MKINELVTTVKTDVSGKWVSKEKLKEYTEKVILECIALCEGNEVGDKLSEYFFKET